MYKHILLPTDGSSRAENAIKAGVRLAASMGARVSGIYVTPNHMVSRGIDRALIGGNANIAETFLAPIAAEAKSLGVECECFHVHGDSAADEIARACERLDCDLIVMASHGHGGVASLILGSETQRVLHCCKVPVLIYR